MYDNLPFITEDKKTILAFLNSGFLQYQNESIKPDKETGEELRTTYSKYGNLTFSVKYSNEGQPLELRCKGSFHYLMNNGKHNADNKTFTEASEFLIDFSKKFGVDLRLLKLLPPEFAVNTVIPFDVVKFIQNLFYEQRKQFNNNAVGHPSKISGKPSNDYRLKVYSKYHEHPSYCDPDTLRMEYQAKKMRGLHRAGIYTIADLLILKNWLKIKELHLSYFKHLVVYDFNILLPKNSKYRKRIADFSNANEWENLVEKIKTGKEYATKYNDEVTTLNFLSKKYGANLLPATLQLAEKQWFKFLKVCENTAVYKVEKPKEAPLYKPKEALFIECTPCLHYVINNQDITGLDNLSEEITNSFEEEPAILNAPEEITCIKGAKVLTINEGVKAIIENHIIELFKSNLTAFPDNKCSSVKGEKFIQGEDVEKVIQQTFIQVKQTHLDCFPGLTFEPACRSKNYFAFPGGSSIGWMKEDIIERFTSTFYLNQKQQQQQLN